MLIFYVCHLFFILHVHQEWSCEDQLGSQAPKCEDFWDSQGWRFLEHFSWRILHYVQGNMYQNYMVTCDIDTLANEGYFIDLVHLLQKITPRLECLYVGVHQYCGSKMCLVYNFFPLPRNVEKWRFSLLTTLCKLCFMKK